MKGNTGMMIETERLTLRPMCREYFASTHEYAADPENTRYMLFLPNDSEDETLQYLSDAEAEFSKEKPSYYEMAVFLGEEHIGAVSLYLSENGGPAEFGWIINKRFHGHGYAAEAAAALLGYAANELGIRRFQAHCDSENFPSRRVMEKLGMALADEYGGRYNKLAPGEERRECLYTLEL